MDSKELELAIRMKFLPLDEKQDLFENLPAGAIRCCAHYMGFRVGKMEDEFLDDRVQEIKKSLQRWSISTANPTIKKLYSNALVRGLTEYYSDHPDEEL